MQVRAEQRQRHSPNRIRRLCLGKHRFGRLVFSATQQVIRSQVSPDSFDASDSITWFATAVPYILGAFVLDGFFFIWALYSVVRWKSYSRLILLALVTVLWIGSLLTFRNMHG